MGLAPQESLVVARAECVGPSLVLLALLTSLHQDDILKKAEKRGGTFVPSLHWQFGISYCYAPLFACAG